MAANIPYYITGEIMRSFLTSKNQPVRMALLVQKEVANRVARSEKESILSLSVKAYGTPTFVKKVSAECFSPPPQVDSAILLIDTISRDFFKDVSEERFFTLVKTGFSSKRKLLAGNLSKLTSREQVETALATCGIPAKIRAEDVSLEQWGMLTRILK